MKKKTFIFVITNHKWWINSLIFNKRSDLKFSNWFILWNWRERGSNVYSKRCVTLEDNNKYQQCVGQSHHQDGCRQGPCVCYVGVVEWRYCEYEKTLAYYYTRISNSLFDKDRKIYSTSVTKSTKFSWVKH